MGTGKSGLLAFKEGLASGSLSRREILKTLAAVGVTTLTLPIISRPALAAPTITVSTWQDYSAPEMFKAYSEAYGGPPGFQLFADNEEALQKIRAGAVPTLVQPGSAIIGRFRDAGLLAPIDTSKLSNYGDIFQSMKDIRGLSDGADVYAVPSVWGDSSIVYRRDLMPEYVDNNTWEILWDSKYSGRLAQRDGMDSVTVPAALVLGIADPYHMSDEDIERIRQKLVEQRPLLRFYWTNQSDLEQALASGEVVAAYGWSSSFSSLKKQGIDVGYMMPKEGRLTWLDTTVRIKGGPGSEEEALAFIDAFISAESGKYLIEKFGYGSPNAKAYEITNPDRLAELGMNNPEALLKEGNFYEEFDPKVSEKINSMFEKVKAGM